MSADSSNPSPQLPPAWASYGTTAEDEDFIVGSPDGLRVLREHIDQAIQNGEAIIHDPRIEFNGIKCKKLPREASPDLWQSSLAGYGCITIMLAILALAIYGATRFFGNVMQTLRDTSGSMPSLYCRGVTGGRRLVRGFWR